MAEHTPKKRRLDAPAALHKPFKSPFRSPTRPANAQVSSSPISTPECKTQLTDTVRSHPPSSPLTPITPRPMLSVRKPQIPRIIALQRENTALITSSRNLRAEVDTIKQALKIEEGDQAAELERLIQVWRVASQTAAEEIFATVRDRVNKMGGVVAWRKKERERKERMEEWSRAGENGGDDDVSDEAEEEEDEDDEGASQDPEADARRQEAREAAREAKAAAREAREIAKTEAAEQQEVKPASADVADSFPDDEGFTMDMMLKEMKVDLDLIGFDAGCQKWVD